jgi:alpha-galactosidase
MLARTAMSSFSDAHELVEIPIIAANLHRLMLPRQSQIWAVLKPTDSERRLVYSLAATFLGRMCLSGDVAALSPAQWKTALDAQRLYGQVAPIIKHGTSRLHRQLGETWRHPRGWQSMVRVTTDVREALLVTHAFQDAPRQVFVPLPGGAWRVVGHFGEQSTEAPQLADGGLVLPLGGDFSGCVTHLVRA